VGRDSGVGVERRRCPHEVGIVVVHVRGWLSCGSRVPGASSNAARAQLRSDDIGSDQPVGFIGGLRQVCCLTRVPNTSEIDSFNAPDCPE
jgi:hypothetical protein